MLFNKNEVRKASEKKVLHKSGKNWIVLSSALLLALAGGAAVSNQTSANADANNNVNDDVQVEAQSLEANPTSGSASATSTKSSASAKSVAAPSLDNTSLVPNFEYNREGNNASAAYYRHHADFDNENIAFYGKTVNSYVSKINSMFPNQTSSLNSAYNTLSGRTSNEQSLAGSYSATYANPNTASELSTKASSANQTTSEYTDSVAYNVLDSTNGYIPRVSNSAKLASEESTVASYANLIYDINRNSGVSQEYSANYDIAKAKADVENNYYNNASNLANTIASNSAANANDLTSAQAVSAAISAGEAVANINSGVDAGFVNSVASNAGFSFTSSVVSSAISQLARYAFTSSADPNSDTVVPSTTFANNQVDMGSHNIEFSAANQANGGNSSVNLIINHTSSALSYWASSYATAHNVNSANAENDAVALIRVVSDTAVQQKYSASTSALNTKIANDKAAINSYAAASDSAKAAAKSASNAYASASDVASNDAILGNHPTLAEIFGNAGTQLPVTAHQFLNRIKANLSNDTTTAHELNGGSDKISNVLNNIFTYGLDNMDSSRTPSFIKSNVLTTSNMNNLFNGIISEVTAASGTTVPLNLITNHLANHIAYNILVDLDNYNTHTSNVMPQKSSFTMKAAGDKTGLINALNSDKNAIVTNLVNATNNTSIYEPGTTVQSLVSYSDAAEAESAALDNPTFASNSAELSAYSAAVSDANSSANATATSYKSVSSASASYAKATDQDVTIASQFNSYYTSLANSDSTATSAAKTSLDNFYFDHADDTYASAFSKYNSAEVAEPNDATLAHANGIYVYKHSPRFITVLKNAQVHSNPNFADSKVLGKLAAGRHAVEVKGIAFDPAGNTRYVVKGQNDTTGYITANSAFVKDTYLIPGQNYTVKFNNPVAVHSSVHFGQNGDKVVGKIGDTVSGTAVSTDTDHGWYGVTRLQIASGKLAGYYVSDNDGLLTVLNNNDNNANNATDKGTDQKGTDNMWWN